MHCVAVGVRKYICAVIIYRLQGGTQHQLSTSKILWHSNHQYHDSCKHITTHCQCIMSSKVGIIFQTDVLFFVRIWFYASSKMKLKQICKLWWSQCQCNLAVVWESSWWQSPTPLQPLTSTRPQQRPSLVTARHSIIFTLQTLNQCCRRSIGFHNHEEGPY